MNMKTQILKMASVRLCDLPDLGLEVICAWLQNSSFEHRINMTISYTVSCVICCYINKENIYSKGASCEHLNHT